MPETIDAHHHFRRHSTQANGGDLGDITGGWDGMGWIVAWRIHAGEFSSLCASFPAMLTFH